MMNRIRIINILIKNKILIIGIFLIGVTVKLSLDVFYKSNDKSYYSIDYRVKRILPEIKEMGYYNIEKALQLAGDNRKELEKVLLHYKENKSDSLKLKSASFLISNMIYHQASYYVTNNFKNLFVEIGKVNNQVSRYKIWDSLAPNYSEFNFQNVVYKNDLEIVTSEFLIQNIEYSFKAWELFPWCKGLTFEDFQNYILPYRMSNEPIENFRPKFIEMYSWVIDSMKSKNNMQEAYELIYNDFNSKYGDAYTWEKYPLPLSYTEFLSAKSGSCTDIGNTLGIILRSMGIKCAHDFSVEWGNRSSAFHSWVSFIENDSLTLFIDNDGKLKKNKYVHSGKFELDEPGNKFLPEKIRVQNYKRGTKIRRNTFKPNPTSLWLNNRVVEKIPKGLNDIVSIDVTKHYIKTSEVSIDFGQTKNLPQYIFLGVFGLGGQLLVDVSFNNNNGAYFRDMGIDVIYFPMAYVDNQLEVISEPFLLKENGEVIEFSPDQSASFSMKLLRKYPLFGNTLNHAHELLGGIFQVSNDSTFINHINLYEINKTYLSPTEIKVNNRNSYRYFRYLSAPNSNGNIAEIRIHSKQRQWDLDSPAVIISNNKRLDAFRAPEKAFDGDLLSYYESKEKASWIGIDFGEVENTIIDKISFSPRSDTNFIVPNNEYELFYWDEKDWVSLGVKKAIDYELYYEKVPSNTFYWLHCINGGKEERPFIYSNGTQIWY